MVPFIVARTTGVGLPRVIKPAASCFDATWLCEALPWQTGMDIAAVRTILSICLLHIHCGHEQFGLPYDLRGS